MENEKDATADSSNALEAAIASSPEATTPPSTETATPQQAEATEQTEQQTSQEEKFGFDDPRHPEHYRFRQLQDEKKFYKEQLENLIQQRQTQQQPTTDPYSNMTPEEERFWRMVDQRAEKVAEKKMQNINPMLDAGLREMVDMKVNSFRNAHPDIKANSPDEEAIAGKIRMGYHPEDAYWAIMGPRGIRNAEEKGKQVIKQQIENKKRANVETSTSVSSQVQPQPQVTKKTWRADWERNQRLADEGKI